MAPHCKIQSIQSRLDGGFAHQDWFLAHTKELLLIIEHRLVPFWNCWHGGKLANFKEDIKQIKEV